MEGGKESFPRGTVSVCHQLLLGDNVLGDNVQEEIQMPPVLGFGLLGEKSLSLCSFN